MYAEVAKLADALAPPSEIICSTHAGMVKLADTQRSGRCGSNPLGVQVSLPAQRKINTVHITNIRTIKIIKLKK